MSSGRHPTIGFVTANIHVGVAETVWAGVADATERHGANLICFPGGELHAPEGHGARRNAVYDLIGPDTLDAVVCWTSAVGLRPETVPRWPRSLDTVSLTTPPGEHAALDSYDAMRTAIRHLVQVHGHRRVACLRGPEDNHHARERFRAYADTLRSCRLPVDAALVSPPADFEREAGASAMRALLDVRGLRPGRDFDAIAACSDVLAFGASRTLSARGIAIPGDVAVVGVNDSPQARLANPPLTSVALPFHAQAEHTVRTLLARLADEPAPQPHRPGPRLVVRRSCGCPAAVTPGSAEDLAYELWRADDLATRLQDISQELITTRDIATLTEVLTAGLPYLGIKSCHLALYDGSFDRARLVFGYDDGPVPLEPGGRPFEARRLVPPGMLPRQRRFSLVVEPLYVLDDPIGFAVFEAGPHNGLAYEVLRKHLSAALKGMMLFQEVLDSRDRAQQADRFKSSLLTNVTRELRTPLNTIIEATEHLRGPCGAAQLREGLGAIRLSAERQLRLIDDVLDLSRADIGALDLAREAVDPRPLLESAFRSVAERRDDVTWRLRLPERLPIIQADPVRLRHVVLSLLGTARSGEVVLGAEVRPPHLRLWVEHSNLELFGPDLELSPALAHRLVRLHGGSISMAGRPDGGEVLDIHLPLPTLGDRPLGGEEDLDPVLLCVGSEAAEMAGAAGLPARGWTACGGKASGWRVRGLDPGCDVDAVLEEVRPTALAWDLTRAAPHDWPLAERLREDPRTRQRPILLYAPPDPPRRTSLWEIVDAYRPIAVSGPVLIVDGDPHARSYHRNLIAKGLPGHAVRTADDGGAALAAMAEDVPGLVVLDLALPDMDGLDLLDRMRPDPRLREVPVLVLTARPPTPADVGRLEPHAQVVALQAKGILSEEETLRAVQRMLKTPRQTSALVLRMLVYLHRNYSHQLTRCGIARAVAVSEDYLSRVFHRDLGISPWDYLNRLRIHHAKNQLLTTGDSIQAVARRVGFRDRAYFSRVFRKLTGVTPQAFREHPE